MPKSTIMLSKDSAISFTEYISSEMPWLVNFVKWCFYGVFVFLDINQYQSSILLIFMALDTCFGMAKSKRLGIPLEWSVLWIGVMCKFVLLVVPMLVALLGKGLGYDFKILVDVVMKAIILNEFISCITNIISIRTKKNVKNKDFISMLLNGLRDMGIRMFESMLSTVKAKGGDK
jgi:hypothetical protein